MEPTPLISYSEFITILLTALTALVAILATVIGLAALWGWAGLKEGAAKAASDAVNLRMNELPDRARMLMLMSRMEAILGSWDEIQSKLVTDTGAKGVVPASNSAVEAATVPPPYPGEGEENASPAADSARKPSTDPG